MIDLTKPIRHLDGRAALVLRTDMTGPEPIVIALKVRDHQYAAWAYYGFRDGDEATDMFENVPPPEEWRWMMPGGDIGTGIYSTRGDCVAHHAVIGLAGQPVRILREGETP